MVHSKRDDGGSETNVGDAEEDKRQRHEEELVEGLESIVKCLNGEEDTHDRKTHPADPETESDDVVFADVGVREVAGDGEKDLGDTVDD